VCGLDLIKTMGFNFYGHGEAIVSRNIKRSLYSFTIVVDHVAMKYVLLFFSKLF
jgi:hypothetical protein